LAGGVSANRTLIKIFKKVFGSKKIIYPEKSLATDNGIKIAFTGYFFIDKAIDYKDLDVDPLLSI
jgi:tRNA A37 threonylcarbamoyltransferase TsaD